MAETIFLDVNVFMYAAGTPHPYKNPCIRILSDVETGVLTATINTEIFQELLYRYYHIGLADKGVQLCKSIMHYPLTVLP
jgi:predicted nucleic acid-binding protein